MRHFTTISLPCSTHTFIHKFSLELDPTQSVILANAGTQELIISPKGSMFPKKEEKGPLRGVINSWVPAFARMTDWGNILLSKNEHYKVI